MAKQDAIVTHEHYTSKLGADTCNGAGRKGVRQERRPTPYKCKVPPQIMVLLSGYLVHLE